MLTHSRSPWNRNTHRRTAAYSTSIWRTSAIATTPIFRKPWASHDCFQGTGNSDRPNIQVRITVSQVWPAASAAMATSGRTAKAIINSSARMRAASSANRPGDLPNSRTPTAPRPQSMIIEPKIANDAAYSIEP